MVKFWDTLLKRLIGKTPQDFVTWFVSEAQFVRELSPHLQVDGLDADALYEIAVGERRCLLHIEFQTRGDASMGERLVLYNILARRKYKLPVYSSVVYLLKGKKALDSPYNWQTWDGPEQSVFHFRSIKLWEVPTTALLEHQQPGLIPLLPLSYEGKRMAVVDQVVESLSLLDNKLQEALSPIAYGVALKLFPNPVDQVEIRRRFEMFSDFVEEVFRESGLMQEMEDKLRKRIEDNLRQEVRQEIMSAEVERFRQHFVALIEARFSDLTTLAKERVALVENIEELEHLFLKVGIASSSAEARRSLLEDDRN